MLTTLHYISNVMRFAVMTPNVMEAMWDTTPDSRQASECSSDTAE